jgi:tetratricopeptide (TPR) repeat protein
MSQTETAPKPATQEESTSPASPAPGENRAPPPVIRPGDAVGRYQIRGLIGSGGMGQVFLALDPQLGRTVALKLVRPEGKLPSSRARTRLLREAQALARLSHPNVVVIHDVGTSGDQVFIAMEHVAGQTLAAWLAAAPRSWRAIRDVFVAAGRGLVAAHEVGTVHRDFKPSNVIVGDSRVVVIDFGLACAGGGCGPERGAIDRASTLDVALTLTGERLGTPRYMAPEQHAGGAVTALADQTAFAISLWEAFFGAAPFPGGTSAEVLQHMADGPPAPPPRSGIPEHVRAALARALAFRPEDRWPTLAALLAELSRDPAAARGRFFATLAFAVAAIAAPLAFVAGRQAPAPSCAAPAPRLWDDATRAEVRTAFLATGAPFAADGFARVDAALHDRVAAWTQGHEEACAATEIRHEQSAALMDTRMGCLARARDQIATFVELLRAADVPVVERAVGAAAGIGDIEACANASALTAVLPAPRDPGAAAAVEALDREVAQAGAEALVGHWKEAFAAGPALVERARALGHPPLLVRALFTAGSIACDAGDPREGTTLLYQAANSAGAAHEDILAARIYTTLVFCAGVKDERFQAGRALAAAAEAALARIGTPLELRARLYRQESRLERVGSGDLIKSFTYAELALHSYQRLYGDDNSEVARSLGEVADVLERLGAYRGAAAVYARALPVLERALGPSHPTLAGYLTNMGLAADEAGDLAGAAADFERALAIEEVSWIPAVPNGLRNLASVRERQGQLDVAAALVRRAHALAEASRRPDHPDFAEDFMIEARIAADRGRLDEAQGLADRAHALLAEAFGPEHAETADVRFLQAEIARQRHDLAGARRLVAEAISAHRKLLGPRHPSVASDQQLQAALLLDAGDARAALPLLEEAVGVQEGARGDGAPEVAMARTLLSEALLATGDRSRALEVATRAHASAGALRADVAGRARLALARARASMKPPARDRLVE